MSDWVEKVEDGLVFYVNDEVGNVVKTPEGLFISMIPKVIRLGPFETLEQAKQAFENKAVLEQMLDQYNGHLLQLCKDLKR